MTDKEKEAIETMQHWIDYEKANKEKINKADELIEIQETVLNLIQAQQEEIEKYKMILAENCARTVNSDLKQKHKHEEDLEALHLGWKEEIKKKDKIIYNSINEIEKIRQYFSEDLQVEFIRILEILKDKKVIDW